MEPSIHGALCESICTAVGDETFCNGRRRVKSQRKLLKNAISVFQPVSVISYDFLDDNDNG